MKRPGAAAIGLGLALWAGLPRAVGDDWKPTDGPNPVVPAAGLRVPNVLPQAVRAGDWLPADGSDVNPVWLPARTPRAVPLPEPRAEVPVGPRTVLPPVTEARAEVPSVPRTAPVVPDLAPLPVIPIAPAVPAPTVSAEPKAVRPASLAPRQDPAPPPRVVEPKPMPLPPPRTTDPPAKALPEPPLIQPRSAPQPELQPAPPELMVPAGLEVGRHGAFGSPPIRLGRDYPSLSELVHGGPLGGGLAEEMASTPATDRLFFQAEYLLWWVNNPQIPILATTTTAPGGTGFLGQPGTTAILGPGAFGSSFRQGLRVRAGAWLDDCGTCGIDGSFFFLCQSCTSTTFDSGTTPVITRPFFAPNLGGFEFGQIVAAPNFSTGALSVQGCSFLWGADVNVRRAICRTCDFRAEWFAGYRFLALDENLSITEFITATNNPPDIPGTKVVVQDRFDTRNRFNGGQLGLAAERNWGRVSLAGRASVALGGTYQELQIDGFQLRATPGATTAQQFRGGLLAVGPNLGTFSQTRFSVVPEFTLNLGYWVTPTLKLYVGYNFLYWTNVIRPGDQIDRVVDVSFVPNPPIGVPPSGQNRPLPTFKQSDLAVNGIQFGLEFRW